MATTDTPTTAPLLVGIADAQRAVGISRSKLYLLIADGTLDARKAGRRTVVTYASLQAYASSLPRVGGETA
jgi:nucleotidyltransferase/DNA polymerase involved in DNA repair